MGSILIPWGFLLYLWAIILIIFKLKFTQNEAGLNGKTVPSVTIIILLRIVNKLDFVNFAKIL